LPLIVFTSGNIFLVRINTFLNELFSEEPANERLFKTMKKATSEAKANGFTPDMMDELLKDDE
jgi:hypothetical protein